MAIKLDQTTDTGKPVSYHRIGELRIDAGSSIGVAVLDSYESRDARCNPANTPSLSREYRFAHENNPDTMLALAYAAIMSIPEWDGATSDDDVLPVKPLPLPPEKPSQWHEWDSVLETWVISQDGLQSAKAAARLKINLARDRAERGGFDAYGKVFDSDDKSINRILSSAQAASAAKSASLPMSVEWTCADNSTITLDADMLLALPLHMAMAGNAIHAKAKALKASIDAASSFSEIEAIVW